MSAVRSALVLLGPPASGKTSVGEQLGARPGVRVLQTGYLLRREVARGSQLGEEVGGDLKAGRLASTEAVMAIVSDAVAETAARLLIFDGFPRSEEQIEPFLGLLQKARLELAAVLVLMVSDDEIRHRLAGRRVCGNCGASYHVDYAPPQVADRCDQCGKALVHREDDQPELIERRLAGYKRLTIPVIAFFEQRYAALTRRMPAEGSPEHTLQLVTEVVEKAGVW
jgi:adenylate kinase